MLRTAASHAVRLTRVVLAASVLAIALPTANVAVARESFWGATETTIAVTELPRHGQQTYWLILQGGPFPYQKDGIVFGNFERRLPNQQRGYYHEYTVPTPGAKTRGARRVVTGGQPLTAPPEFYYTGDHYETFCQIGGM